MRKFYWYLTAYIKKHGLVFTLSLVSAIVLFSLFLPAFVSNLEKGQRKYIGIVGEYTLDTLPSVITNRLSVGLTTIEPDGSTVPALAERWTVENDGKTYRFVLKQNLFWNDGKPLEPSDLQYAFKDVETILTPNDIVFKLPDAYAPFPTLVSQPVFRTVSEPRFWFFTRQNKVGLGENKITNYSTQGTKLKQITIDGPDTRHIYRFYLTEEDAVTAFKMGEIDAIPDLQRKHDIFQWPTVSVTPTLHTDRYLAVFFNIRNSQFQKNIRQGLAYALDKPASDVRALGPISVDSWAYLESIKSYDKDPDRAVERLMDPIPGKPLQFELTTTTLFAAQAEAIKTQWEAIGDKAVTTCQSDSKVENKADCGNLDIAVQVRIASFPDVSSFEVLLVGQESPSDPDQYALWHSEQSTNFTGYKNIRIDNLLEKGRQSFNQQERTETYQEFQQFFLEDSPAIFMKYLETYAIERM